MIAEPIPTQPNAVKIVAKDPTNDAINGRVRAAIDEAFARKAEALAAILVSTCPCPCPISFSGSLEIGDRP